MERKRLLRDFVKDSSSELHEIVKEYECELREVREESQQSRRRKGQKNGHGNVSQETRFGEDNLRMLLDIEERLRILRHDEDNQHLWEIVVMDVREWWLKIKYEEDVDTSLDEEDVDTSLDEEDVETDLDEEDVDTGLDEEEVDTSLDEEEVDTSLDEEEVDISLGMMWNSNDAVWLLGCAEWTVMPVQILQRVRDTLKQAYPRDIQAVQYPHTPDGREKLLGDFQQRLVKWKYCAVSLGQQHKDLNYLLRYWIEQSEVRQAIIGTIMPHVVICIYRNETWWSWGDITQSCWFAVWIR